MADKEYIEREEAKNAIFDYICGHTMSKFPSEELLKASKMGAEGAFYEIECVPTADVVEVRRGEWIRPTKIGNQTFDIPHCSACKYIPCESRNYCPKCGADMRGERDDR